MTGDAWILAGKTYQSRLLVGTGRYRDAETLKAAVEASGAEIITVALRRLQAAGSFSIQDVLPPERYTYLPNSAGCKTAEEAVRLLRLARELGGWNLVKLEVITDDKTLLPHPEETVKAAHILAKEGFAVMAYTTDDLDIAQRLEDAGCAAVMPLGSPIGSGLGIQNPAAIEKIIQKLACPVLIDAGIGTTSDATIAMELGCSAVLLNTAIVDAKDPVAMARAMKLAVEAGRQAFLAGRMAVRRGALPSSPSEGVPEPIRKKV